MTQSPGMEPSSRSSSREGYTIIELLVVMAIVSILSAIAIPTMQNMRTRYYERVAKQELADSYEAAKRDYREQRDTFVNSSAVLRGLRFYEQDKRFDVGNPRKDASIYVSVPDGDSIVLSKYSRAGTLCTITFSAASPVAPEPTCDGSGAIDSGAAVVARTPPTINWVNDANGPVRTVNVATNGSSEISAHDDAWQPYGGASRRFEGADSRVGDRHVSFTSDGTGKGIEYTRFRSLTGTNPTAFAAGQRYVASWWARSGSGRQRVSARFGDQTVVTDVGTGWKRYAVAFTPTSASNSETLRWTTNGVDGGEIHLDGVTVHRALGGVPLTNPGGEALGTTPWATSGTMIDSGATVTRVAGGAAVGSAFLRTTTTRRGQGVQFNGFGASAFQHGVGYVALFRARGTTAQAIRADVGDPNSGTVDSDDIRIDTTWRQYAVLWTPDRFSEEASMAFKGLSDEGQQFSIDEIVVIPLVRAFDGTSPGASWGDDEADPAESASEGYSIPTIISSGTPRPKSDHDRAHFEWEISGDAPDTTSCRFDNVPVACSGTSWDSPSDVSLGDHEFRVEVSNDRGSDSRVFQWQQVPTRPHVYLQSVPTDPSTATTYTVTWTTSGVVDTQTCSIDGGAPVSCTSATSHTFTLPEPTTDAGIQRTFTVRVQNSNDDDDVATYTWLQRPKIPTVTGFGVSPTVANGGSYYANAVDALGGVGEHWRLGERSGSQLASRPYNASTSDPRYANVGSGVSINQPGLVVNETDRAIRFPGTAAGALTTIGGVPGLGSSGVFTLSVWVHPTATRAATVYTGNATLAIDASGRPYGAAQMNGTGVTVLAPAALPLNETSHLVLTYEAGALRIYVNGTQRNAVANPNPPQTVASTAIIGPNFQGVIDEISFHTVHAPPAAVQALYTAGNRGRTAVNPQASWNAQRVVTSSNCRLRSSAYGIDDTRACASPFALNPSGLGELRAGSYDLTLTTTNSSGTSTWPYNFTVGMPAPSTKIVARRYTTQANSSTGSATIWWATDGEATSVSCTLDGSPYSCSLGSQPTTVTGLSRGTHTFTVTASNAQGAGTMASTTWTQTLPRPVVSFQSVPGNPAPSTTTSGTITWSVTNDFTSATCTFTRANNTTTTAPCTTLTSYNYSAGSACTGYNGTVNPSLTVTVANTDQTSIPTTYNWRISCAPVSGAYINGRPGDYAYASGTISGYASNAYSCQIYLPWAGWATCSSAGNNYNYSYTENGKPYGAHAITMRFTNQDGSSYQDASWTWTRQNSQDLTTGWTNASNCTGPGYTNASPAVNYGYGAGYFLGTRGANFGSCGGQPLLDNMNTPSFLSRGDDIGFVYYLDADANTAAYGFQWNGSSWVDTGVRWYAGGRGFWAGSAMDMSGRPGTFLYIRLDSNRVGFSGSPFDCRGNPAVEGIGCGVIWSGIAGNGSA